MHEQDKYKEIEPSQAYTLQNAGGVVLVCTKGGAPRPKAQELVGNPLSALPRYDLAPVAWCCPLDYDPVTKMIVVLDVGHKTYADIVSSGYFALALPGIAQKNLVENAGSISGHDVDKYSSFKIAAFAAGKIDVLIPEGVSGWIECMLERVEVFGSSGLVVGATVRAAAKPDAWRDRLHHVGGKEFFSPGSLVS